MPKVSVIVPVYNVAAYLPKCVESIQNQTERDIEIILVDDGSTDDSGTICEEYAQNDARIKVLHQENSGQGAARNNGLSVACGTYVLFVDSDDWIEPDLIAETYGKAVDFQAEILIFNCHAVQENGTEVYTIQQNVTENTVLSLTTYKELLLTDPSPWNKLFMRSFLADTGFSFPTGVWYEDLIAMTQLEYYVKRTVYIGGKPLYNYFLRNNSALRNGNAQRTVEQRTQAIQKIWSFYAEKGALEAYREELEWIAIFHGFFLPAREILNFPGDPNSAIHQLKETLLTYCKKPFSNAYYATLSKKEKMIFKLLYQENYGAIHALVKVNRMMKGLK
ncbi:MAG: glycosyltransferase family 2 protein [Candidatus Fimenecus sp.]